MSGRYNIERIDIAELDKGVDMNEQKLSELGQ